MSSSLAWASVASECTDSACATAYLLESHPELDCSGVLKASIRTNLLQSPPGTCGTAFVLERTAKDSARWSNHRLTDCPSSTQCRIPSRVQGLFHMERCKSRIMAAQ